MTSLQELNETLKQQVLELTYKLELKEKEIDLIKSPNKTLSPFETHTLELQLIQYKHSQIKLEKENEQLRNKLNQMINSQVETQKTLLKQKQQIQNVNTNLFSLSSQIQEEDSPIKLIINKLIGNEQDPKITQSLDIETQLKLNELKRVNNQLEKRIKLLEEKSQSMVARQFQDVATIMKLKKEKKELIDQQQQEKQALEQELQKSRVQDFADVTISLQDLYSDISNIEQIKEKFQILIQLFLRQLLTQNSNYDLNESILKSNRSSSSRRIDQIQNQFNDILKHLNIGSLKSRDIGQENCMSESFVCEKPQSYDKQTQTLNSQNDANAENVQNKQERKLEILINNQKNQEDCQFIDAEQQTEDQDLNQFLLSSMTPLMLSALPQLQIDGDLIEEQQQQQSQDKSTICLKSAIKNDQGFDEGQLIGIVEGLTIQLNYTKKQWFNSIDKCLRAQQELERLSEIESQYNYLSHQYLDSKSELVKQKNRYQTLLDKFFVLELENAQQ